MYSLSQHQIYDAVSLITMILRFSNQRMEIGVIPLAKFLLLFPMIYTLLA